MIKVPVSYLTDIAILELLTVTTLLFVLLFVWRYLPHSYLNLYQEPLKRANSVFKLCLSLF